MDKDEYINELRKLISDNRTRSRWVSNDEAQLLVRLLKSYQCSLSGLETPKEQEEFELSEFIYPH